MDSPKFFRRENTIKFLIAVIWKLDDSLEIACMFLHIYSEIIGRIRPLTFRENENSKDMKQTHKRK